MKVQLRAIDWLVSLVKNCPADYTIEGHNDPIPSDAKMFEVANVYDWPKTFDKSIRNEPVALVYPVAEHTYHTDTEERANAIPTHDYIIIEILQESMLPAGVSGKTSDADMRTYFRRAYHRCDVLNRFIYDNIPDQVRRLNNITSHNDGFRLEKNYYIFEIVVCLHSEKIPDPLPDPTPPPNPEPNPNPQPQPNPDPGQLD